MTVLNVVLAPDAVGRLHDVLLCLGKFSEFVSLEVYREKVSVAMGFLLHLLHHLIDDAGQLVLSALNSSKSTHASFTLDGQRFFAKYRYSPNNASAGDQNQFNCQIYNKVRQAPCVRPPKLRLTLQALYSVFKGRPLDAREKDTAIEKCELSIRESPARAECRLVVRITCKHGGP